MHRANTAQIALIALIANHGSGVPAAINHVVRHITHRLHGVLSRRLAVTARGIS